MPQTPLDPEAGLSDALRVLAARAGLSVAWSEAVAAAGDATLAPLRLARAAGLRCRRLRLDWDGLVQLAPALPAVLLVRDARAMILEAVAADAGTPVVVLTDPADAAAVPLRLDRLRLEAAWTGEVVVARAARGADAGETPFGWSAILRILGHEPALLRDLLASALVVGLLALAPILFAGLVVGRVIPSGTDRSLLVVSLGLLAAVLCEVGLAGVRDHLTGVLATRVEARLAVALFDRLLASPLAALEARPAGETMRRIAGLGTLCTTLGGPLAAAVLDMAALLAVLPLMAYLAPVPTLAVVVVGALCGAGLMRVAGPMRRLAADSLDADGARAALLLQSLRGIATIKGLALGRDRLHQWDRLSAAAGVAELSLARRADALQAIAPLMERVLVIGTLALTLFLATAGGAPAPLALLVVVTLLAQRLVAPLRPIGALMAAWAEARAAVASLAALTGPPAEAVRGAGSGAPRAGAIAAEDVRFRYPGAPSPVLRGVSFAVPAGTMLGIMGPAGAGKSTLVRLLQRTYAGHEGRLLLDGAEVASLDPDQLRRAVLVLGPDDALFAGTIRETLLAGRPDASFDRVAAATRAAAADEFIERLPRGYETLLHDGAPSLSTGQRQRLALARALVADPAVLVLDEALGALDAGVEDSVEAGLRAARAGRTTIIVSHRLATLAAADAILVLDEGRVRDLGPHADLVERCDLYAAAWRRECGVVAADAAGDERFLLLA